MYFSTDIETVTLVKAPCEKAIKPPCIANRTLRASFTHPGNSQGALALCCLRLHIEDWRVLLMRDKAMSYRSSSVYQDAARLVEEIYAPVSRISPAMTWLKRNQHAVDLDILVAQSMEHLLLRVMLPRYIIEMFDGFYVTRGV